MRLSRLGAATTLVAATGLATAGLAYRALATARSHQATVEGVLRDYAAGAAWQFAQRAGMHLGQGLRESGSMSDPIDLRQHAMLTHLAGVERHGRAAPPAMDVPRFRADTVLARAAASASADTSRTLWAAAIIPAVGGSWRLAVTRPVSGAANGSTRVVTYWMDSAALAAALAHVARIAPLLPPTLAKDVPNESLMAIGVMADHGRVVFAIGGPTDGAYTATDTLPAPFGRLRAVIGLRQDAAGRLIIGGVPRSQLTSLAALTLLAGALLVVALAQLRRGEELARLRTDFVTGVSHELRTPLAQITLFAETLTDGPPLSRTEQRMFLGIIRREATRLAQLVERVLRFGAIERGGGGSGRPHVGVAAAQEIEDAVIAFRPLASHAGSEIALALERRVEVAIDADSLRQVVLNLLDNAIRHGGAGKPVTVGLDAQGERALLTITDGGPGIPREARARVFEPFTRLGGSATGSGIGLAVVRSIVEASGGVVRIDDAPAGGTTVVVELRVSHEGTVSLARNDRASLGGDERIAPSGPAASR